MQTRNPILDDISRVMQGAAGVAQAANDEAKAVFEIQVTAEKEPLAPSDFASLHRLASGGIQDLIRHQQQALGLTGR
jgi:ribonuclease PH